MEAPASVLTPPLQPHHTLWPSVGVENEEEGEQSKKKRTAERGREEEEVAGQLQRKGTDVASQSLSHMELKGTLQPLVSKCF